MRDVAASSVGERILCTSSMIIYWIQGTTDEPSAMSDRSTKPIDLVSQPFAPGAAVILLGCGQIGGHDMS